MQTGACKLPQGCLSSMFDLSNQLLRISRGVTAEVVQYVAHIDCSHGSQSSSHRVWASPLVSRRYSMSVVLHAAVAAPCNGHKHVDVCAGDVAQRLVVLQAGRREDARAWNKPKGFVLHLKDLTGIAGAEGCVKCLAVLRGDACANGGRLG